jgi:thymidylate synthase (FAD)
MQVIKPYHEILDPIDGEKILSNIERIGRVCYKSENLISAESSAQFVKNL